MRARLRKLGAWLVNTFWLIPAAMTLVGVLLAFVLIAADHSRIMTNSQLENSWLYSGGATGARTLLGAIASSTIGVAGTVFSITIAALSLAAGQMGPRLLRNFTSDRSNQFTLGVFVGTFSYALLVLRAVRTQGEGVFVPHLALTVAIALAFVCVATLVFFVGHMAGRINVDTVISLVSNDMQLAFDRIAKKDRQPEAPPPSFWSGATVIFDSRQGYLQQLDESGLAKWAASRGTTLRLLARPGDYVFPGAPVALMTRPAEGAADAIRDATALSSERGSSADMKFAVRQLVEVAVRALSSGINDPYTALTVIDRFGATLCKLAPLHLPSGVLIHEGTPVLVSPSVDYDGLLDDMFHMIRQNGSSSPVLLMRMLEVLTVVMACDQAPSRRAALQRHADLLLGDAKRNIHTPEDLRDIVRKYAGFMTMKTRGPLHYLNSDGMA